MNVMLAVSSESGGDDEDTLGARYACHARYQPPRRAGGLKDGVSC